jgi:ABC-type transport system involved in multi-copper enzyme maturation permease subunit
MHAGHTENDEGCFQARFNIARIRAGINQIPSAKKRHRRMNEAANTLAVFNQTAKHRDMTWLPVVEREMRVAARRRATYRIRFWAVLVMMGLFAFAMIDTHSRGNASQAGRELLEPLSFLAFFFAISIGVIATSDSVSEEKREGTLGLLFLTDLKGYDVILGKLVAHSINAFYALVAIMPILGMPLLLGGVTMSQFVKLIIALVSAIVFSLAAGIFVSTHSRNERKAMVFTFLLLAAVTCVPFLVMVWLSDVLRWCQDKYVWRGLMFSPGFALGMAFDGPPFWPAVSYWYGVGWSWIGAIGLLFIAARKAPRSWTESAAKPVVRRAAAGGGFVARMKSSRRKLLDDNPFLWLAMRGEASQARVWLFILAIFAIWLVAWTQCGSLIWSYEVVFPTVMILHVGLKIWVVGEASRRFVEDRRNNAMEFLLSTPLDERQIVRGQWRALNRQFLGPIVAVLLWETVMAFAMPHYKDWNNFLHSQDRVPQLLCSMFFLPVDVVALGWAAMWLGMTSKGRGRAMLTGLALVLLLPWLLTQLFMTMGEKSGLLGGASVTGPPAEVESVKTGILFCTSLMISLVVIIWAQARLLINFRRLALSGGSC